MIMHRNRTHAKYGAAPPPPSLPAAGVGSWGYAWSGRQTGNALARGGAVNITKGISNK